MKFEKYIMPVRHLKQKLNRGKFTTTKRSKGTRCRSSHYPDIHNEHRKRQVTPFEGLVLCQANLTSFYIAHVYV